MTEKEKILLAGCIKGEKAAWDALVLQYSKLAYSTIRSTLTLHHALPQDDIVEDLHQDFFLSLCENDFRKLRQFRGERGCSVASWLRVIASRITELSSTLGRRLWWRVYGRWMTVPPPT
jgi:hypothetical protein